MTALTICWFRRDLRVQDHPALAAAAQRGAVLPLYVHPATTGPWSPGAASRVWRHHSLMALDRALATLGSPLAVVRADDEGPMATVIRLARAVDATAIYVNALPYPDEDATDAAMATLARGGDGLTWRVFPPPLLQPNPTALRTQSGGHFRVFTPYWKALVKQPIESPLTAPSRLLAPSPEIQARVQRHTVAVDALGLTPPPHQPPWDQGFWRVFTPGEDGAWARWATFSQAGLDRYDSGRNRPALDAGVSRLSPHLHFGEITPRQLWHAVAALHPNPLEQPGAETFLRELGWRDFAHYTLHHHPETPDESLDRRFLAYPWADDRGFLRAWQRGETGIPLVDAGMRQLRQQGWMHNRVRMVTASFLVKNGRLPWQWGAKWFWNCLVDADLASNTLGWQWVAGCGTDAAPYFRVFNPIKQADEYDPQGDYLAQFLPELALLPPKWRSQPFLAPAAVLSKAGIRLGVHYPHPICDLAASRQQALDGFAQIKPVAPKG